MIVKSSPGVFRVGQSFQRGDLSIYVTDMAGNPLDPYSVKYTLLYQPQQRYSDRPAVSCNPIVAGPCLRTPVQAALGEYYVTGCAGDCGQPGQWYVQWVLQEYFEGPLLGEQFGFEVFDTAQYFPPGVGMAGRSSGCGSQSTTGPWCCRPNPCGCRDSRGW